MTSGSPGAARSHRLRRKTPDLLRSRPLIAGVGVAMAWTGLAAWAGWKVHADPPLAVELGGWWLFLASRFEVLVAWFSGLLLLGLLVRVLRRRRLSLVVSVAALLVLLVAFLVWASPAPGSVGWTDRGTVEPSDRTTLLVGIDGLTWNAILPLVREGQLPVLERLMEQGSYGVLHSLASTRPSNGGHGFWSPVVWTSIATGVGPEAHGIDDFVIRESEAERGLAATYHRESPAFWNLFPRFGRQVGVVGWWATWPAEEIDGVIASSSLGLRGAKRTGGAPGEYGASELDLPRLVHPESMTAQIQRLFPSPEEVEKLVHERLFRLDLYPLDLGRKREVVYSVARQDRFYLEIARYLLRTTSMPLYAVYFEGPDVVSHQFWRFRKDPVSSLAPGYEVVVPKGFTDHGEVVDRYYRLVDEYLGQLLEELPEEATVIVCSDHGFRDAPDHPQDATHSGRGVLLARGPGIARGRSLNLSIRGSLQELTAGRTDVLDILPTLLYLHGLPIADTLEGQILTRLLTRELVERQPAFRIAEYAPRSAGDSQEAESDPEIDREYERRLRALGYID